MKFAAKFIRHQRGTAVIEAVIVTPVLLLLVLGTAEVTNAFVDHNTLTKAVRSGARYAASTAVAGTTGVVFLTPDVISEVRNLVVYGSANGAGEPVLRGLGTGDVQVTDLGGNNVQVTATYGYTGILGASLQAFGFGSSPGLNHSLRATVSMRAL